MGGAEEDLFGGKPSIGPENYVTPSQENSNKLAESITQASLPPTSYGIPQASPLGPQEAGNNVVSLSGSHNQQNNLAGSQGSGFSPPIAQTNGVNGAGKGSYPTSTQSPLASDVTNAVFGVSSSAISGQSTIGLDSTNDYPSSAQPFSGYPNTIGPTAFPTTAVGATELDEPLSTSYGNTFQDPNTNNVILPNQLQVIASIGSSYEDSGSNQPDDNNYYQPNLPSSASPQFNSNSPSQNSIIPHNPTTTTFNSNDAISSSSIQSVPATYSSQAQQGFDPAVDGYGSPLAAPLGTSDPSSDIDGYGAPLADPLAGIDGYGAPLADAIDGYGAPQADPLGSAYGAPLAQPLSQSYGAPVAAPISRYQSASNSPGPPLPPPLPPGAGGGKRPLPAYSFGRALRLSRYLRNRFKRRFPTFHFRG